MNIDDDFGYRKLRKGRWSGENQVYLITTVTKHRQKVFENFWQARKLITVLRLQRAESVETMAFVVMPDHLHWLIQLKCDSLDVVMKRVKSMSARRLGGPTWQSGFHDRAVRQEDDLLTMARYIVANPLRAGLVTRLGDYPHWDAIWV